MDTTAICLTGNTAGAQDVMSSSWPLVNNCLVSSSSIFLTFEVSEQDEIFLNGHLIALKKKRKNVECYWW